MTQENTENQPTFTRYISPREYETVTFPKHILYDTNLSGNARILLMTMIDLGYIKREDGKPWQFFHFHLIKKTGFTRHLLDTAMDNLISQGYVIRERQKVNGRNAHYNYKYCAFPDFLESQLKLNNLRVRKNDCRSATVVNSQYTKTNKDCSSLIDIKGNDAMPFSQEKVKTKKQPSRRKPLTDEQQGIFVWLKSKEIIGATDDTLTYWSCAYPMQKIQDAVYALEHEKKRVKNPAGYIRFALDGKMVLKTETTQKNKEFAQKIATQHKFSEWEIQDKYLFDHSLHRDIPFHFQEEEFKNHLYDLIERKKGHRQCNVTA